MADNMTLIETNNPDPEFSTNQDTSLTMDLLAGDELKIESDGEDWLRYELAQNARITVHVHIEY